MSPREIMEWDAGKAHLLDGPEREHDMPAAKVAELLTPNRQGLLLLIDWEHGHPREDGPPEDALLTAGEAIQELAGAGLKAHRVDAPFTDRYTLLATATPGSKR